MSNSRSTELAAAVLRAFQRVRDVVVKIEEGGQGVSELPSYQQCIEKAVILSPDLMSKLFRLLLDLSDAFQHIYLDSMYRSNLRFNSSLDLSEIYSYSNPSPSRNWSAIVRFSIKNHDKKKTEYNVLPTTVLELLFFLRRFYRSCRYYGDYSLLDKLLSDPRVQNTDGLEEQDELSVPMIWEFSDALPLSSFLSIIQASSSEESPRNPAKAFLDLTTEGNIHPIDAQVKEVLGRGSEGMARYNDQYLRVFGHLESRRAYKRINNSIDARSYQLSLALNDLADIRNRYTYMPFLSSGMPLSEFVNVGWEKDPLVINPEVKKDETLDREDLRAMRVFTTARSPHYHYLITLLRLRYPESDEAVAASARDNLTKVKAAIDDWSKTIHRLDYRRTKPGPLSALRKAILGIDKGTISDDVLELLAVDKSARSRAQDQEFRERLLKDPQWIRGHFPDRDTYDRIIHNNFDEIRNHVLVTVDQLGDVLQILLDAEKQLGGGIFPELQELVLWAGKLIEGKEE